MKLNVEIKRTDEGLYLAVCLSLPGCVSRAASLEQVKHKVQDAVCGYLASVGNFVPDKIDHLLEFHSSAS